MQHKNQNDLIRYRERMGFTQQHVAAILGQRTATVLSKLEQGHRLPTVTTIFKLASLYRVPVEFLYTKFYMAIREEIRNKEALLLAPQLPLRHHHAA